MVDSGMRMRRYMGPPQAVPSAPTGIVSLTILWKPQTPFPNFIASKASLHAFAASIAKPIWKQANDRRWVDFGSMDEHRGSASIWLFARIDTVWVDIRVARGRRRCAQNWLRQYWSDERHA